MLVVVCVLKGEVLRVPFMLTLIAAGVNDLLRREARVSGTSPYTSGEKQILALHGEVDQSRHKGCSLPHATPDDALLAIARCLALKASVGSGEYAPNHML